MKTLLKIFALTLLLLCNSCKNDLHKHYTIGVSQCSNDEWRTKMNKEMRIEALCYDNLSVEVLSANDKNEQQISDIKYLINKKVDLLVVAPNEAVPITPIVEEAYNNGIPVIVVDRKIFSDRYSAFVGADNYQIGKDIGHYVLNEIGNKGTVVELTGLSGSTPAIERHQGFFSIIKKHPLIKVLYSKDAQWQSDSAYKIMTDILSVNKNINVVFAHNDRMAYGAYLAAREAGCEKRIKFIGIDALPGEKGGVSLVKKGILNATFIYPTGGDKVIQIAAAILSKSKYLRNNILNTAIINKDNARVMELQTNQIYEQEKKIELLNLRIYKYLLQYTNQRFILYCSIGFITLFIILIIVLLHASKSKSKLNKALVARNCEVTEQKQKLEDQHKQLIVISQELEAATQRERMFITNISHDLRTPLTLISAPLDRLMRQEVSEMDKNHYYFLIRKNVDILLRLANQVLDFRKYCSGKLDLNLSKVDLVDCITTWNSSFQVLLLKKHLKFYFQNTLSMNSLIYIDIEKFERIYYNLLSNAYKYTPENGHIKVLLSSLQKKLVPYFQLSIYNSGSYISEEQKKHIFTRFYNASKIGNNYGIGLALTKAFVEMHNGTIYVDSDANNGTTFTVEIPICNSANEDSQKASQIKGFNMLQREDLMPQQVTEEVMNCSKLTLLIIDDDADISSYIKMIFKDEFHVITASDGIEGIKKAIAIVPDLIISDVMMPGIDGMECAKRLKNELHTSHIPIILLTAYAVDEQRIEGFNSGADAYLSKPFNDKVLLAIIHNLIENRNNLRKYFTDSQKNIKVNVVDADKYFMEELTTLIEKNIDNSELTVEVIGKNMGFSRVQLYRKIKALTNLSPNEFLRVTRLKAASVLLASSQITVAEVAYKVGFSSPSYFTKCFKSYFGEDPINMQKRYKR